MKTKLGALLVAILIPLICAVVAAQETLVSSAALSVAHQKLLEKYTEKMAKEGFREEFELLLGQLEIWGLERKEVEELRTEGRAALLKAKQDPSNARILRETQSLLKKLARGFEKLPDEEKIPLAHALLFLDSTVEVAHEALEHESFQGEWMDVEQAACRKRRVEIFEVLQEARKIEIELTVQKSQHPVLVAAHGPGTVVTYKGMSVHSAFDEHRAARIMREGLRAMAVSNYLLKGKLEIPELPIRTRVWFNSRADYEKAAKAAIAAGALDDLYARYALQWGGYFQKDGTGVFNDPSESNATAVLFNYLRIETEGFGDTQAVLQAGHLNWVTRSYLGVPMAGGFWFEETAGGGPPKYDRGLSKEEEEERELLLRMSEGGIAGSRAYLKYLVETKDAPPLAGMLLKETGMITDKLLLKAIHVVEYLQERGDFPQVLSATTPGSIDVAGYEELFRKAVGPLPEFDRRWEAWLIGSAPGILQRLGGTNEKRKLTSDEKKLLAHLDRLREQSFGLMDWHRIPKLALNDSLSQGCRLHARYLAMNPKQLEAWPDAHEEYADCEGFTPEGCWAGLHSVIYPGVRDGVQAVDGWMATYYHRLPLLEYGLIAIGFGLEGTTAVLDSGSLVAPDRGDWIAVWPAPDATNVPCRFTPELPNPVPGEDQASWGYPITLQCSNGDGLMPSEGFLHLFVGGDRSNAVPCHFSSPAKPTNLDIAPPGAFCLMPKAHLKPKTRYTVIAEIENGPSKTWSFTTGSE